MLPSYAELGEKEPACACCNGASSSSLTPEPILVLFSDKMRSACDGKKKGQKRGRHGSCCLVTAGREELRNLLDAPPSLPPWMIAHVYFSFKAGIWSAPPSRSMARFCLDLFVRQWPHRVRHRLDTLAITNKPTALLTSTSCHWLNPGNGPI